MLDFFIRLQNEKVLLRPLIKDDLEIFMTLTNNSKMWLWFTNDLSDLVELEKWVNNALFDAKNKSRLTFTTIDKSTGNSVGSTSLGNYSQRDSRIEIGWTWLADIAQGKRINDQAKLLLMEYCFEILKLQRVEFKTDVLNVPARKAMQRMGFIEEGILRSHTLMSHGRRRDTIYYSVLKKEWPAVKQRINSYLKTS